MQEKGSKTTVDSPPSARPLSQLVDDWGGFERLVAQLHETGEVTVQHDVTLIGKSGAPRQIDVLVTHTQGLYKHLIVLECKYRNSPIERLHVDALASTIEDIGASKGVIFSIEGFQSGAIKYAEFKGIELFKVRELTDEEWGLPGRVIEINLQVIGLSIDAFHMPGTLSFEPFLPKKSGLDLRFSDKEEETSKTRIIDPKTELTLEDIIRRAAIQAAEDVLPAGRYVQDDKYDIDVRYKLHVNANMPEKTTIEMNGGIVIADRMEFDLGVELLQSRLIFDRGEKFVFVLAIEDCVRSVVNTASRSADEQKTVIQESVREPMEGKGEIYQNGSLIRVMTKGFMPFDKFAAQEINTMVAVPSAREVDKSILESDAAVKL